MKNRIRALLATVALIAAGTVAWAGGSFQTLPILGGASYCASTVTGTGNLGGITGQGQGTIGSICGQTVPAGPAWFTGTEVFPADLYAPGTNTMAGGPQTVVVPITDFVTGTVQPAVTTGTTYAVPNNAGVVAFNLGAGTMAATLPAAPINNQVVKFSNISTTAITSFSVAANTGQTLTEGAAIASLAAQTTTATASVSYIYYAAGTTWYRI